MMPLFNYTEKKNVLTLALITSIWYAATQNGVMIFLTSSI